MSSKEVSFDSNYLYVDEQKFFPILQEIEEGEDALDCVNGVVIRVWCGEDADFSWDEAYALAEKAEEADKWILWDLDFGFHEKKVFLQDSASFFSCGITIDEFVKRLYQPFAHRTIGAILFRGSVDLAKYFVWTELQEQYYLERKKEKALPEDLSRKLFAADVFAEYLQRLSSFLPDVLLPFAFLDLSSLEDRSVQALFVSKERFHHLALGLKGAMLPLGCLNWEEGKCFGGWVGKGFPYFVAIKDVPLAVCIPLEEKMNEEISLQLDRIFMQLEELQVPYRVVFELYLNESWDGVDELIVLGSSVSVQGARKLKGFLAAGGKIIDAELVSNLDKEISLMGHLG